MEIQPEQLCKCRFFLDETNNFVFIPEKSKACADHEAQGVTEAFASYDKARLEKIALIKAAHSISEADTSMLQTKISTPHGIEVVLDTLSQSQKDLMDILYPEQQFARNIDIKAEYVAEMVLKEDKTFVAVLPESNKKTEIESAVMK